MEQKIPADRRITPRMSSGHLVVHSDVAEKDPNRTLGMSVTLDLNEFGVMVQSTEAITLGERYRFSIALGDQIVEALGQVVHVNRALNGTFEMGIEFLEISARNIEKLRAHAAFRKEI
jgi:hypothetical protein